MSVIHRPIGLPLGLFALMVAVSLLGFGIRPQQVQIRQLDSSVKLELAVPMTIGKWRHLPGATGIVANPETQALLDKLYSQILTRTYIDDQGYRIMLSIVYGEDQRGGLQAHRPEVCYPAQGFDLMLEGATSIRTAHGPVAAKRLMTRRGQRTEPVTYWFSLGGRPVTNDVERRVAEMRLALVGKIPDGFLVRVSSIDGNRDDAFRRQEAFASQLLDAVPAGLRLRLSGL